MPCWPIFGWAPHRLVSIQTFDGMNGERIGCLKCHRQWAMNHSIRAILEWDRELEDMYYGLLKFPRPDMTGWEARS